MAKKRLPGVAFDIRIGENGLCGLKATKLWSQLIGLLKSLADVRVSC